MTISFTPHIQRLPDTVPFIGPETLERNNKKPFIARLGANESAFGISPRAQAAISGAISREGCSWYGDPENFELRSLLSDKHKVSMDNICVDAGIDSLLGLCVRLFISPVDVVVTSRGAYPTVNYHVSGYAGTLQTVPYLDNHEDPIALAEAANDHGARLVYLSNPDNPMGTCLEPEAIATLLNKLPDNCLLLLDEAYVDFMTKMPVLALDVQDTRLIRFRTFSKAYGLAGMRIGYCLGHQDIIAGFNRIRNHFAVNKLAQIAAAASLLDDTFLPGVVEKVNEGRNRIYALATRLGLSYVPSSTNFVTVNIGSATKAEAMLESLADVGVFVRKPGMAPHDQYVRFGVGTAQEHQCLEDALI